MKYYIFYNIINNIQGGGERMYLEFIEDFEELESLEEVVTPAFGIISCCH